MGLVKWFCSKFNCKSSCTFNNDIFDLELSNKKLNDFKLKNKDLIIIHKILSKRGRLEIVDEITETSI